MNTKFFASFAMTAALTVVGANATQLKAKVDFPFKASSASMPAGMYEIVRESINGTSRFYLRTPGKNVIVVATVVNAAKGTPSLNFRCGASECGLVSISTGEQSYTTTKPVMNRSDKERLISVNIDRFLGE
jgi:hypothetical protein